MTVELSEDRIASLQDVFSMFDVDQDGFIGFTELKDMLISLGRSPTDDHVRHILNIVVKDDEDKRINFAEFLNIVAKDQSLWEPNSESQMRQLFRMFDRDNDGYVTHEEIKRAIEQQGDSISHSEVQDMISEADTDGDGRLTFEEFEAVMNKCHGN